MLKSFGGMAPLLPPMPERTSESKKNLTTSVLRQPRPACPRSYFNNEMLNNNLIKKEPLRFRDANAKKLRALRWT